MKLYFFCAPDKAANQCTGFSKILKEGLPGWRVHSHEDLDSLIKDLRSPLGSQSLIVVLHLQEQAEIDQLLRQRDLLKGLEIVLILPEEPGGMGAKTWLLEPRISFYGLPSGYALCAILQKMAQRLASRPHLGSVDSWHAPTFVGGSGLITEEL